MVRGSTKVANGRGPVINLTVAINDHTADVKVSGGPSADQAFRGCVFGSDPCQGVKVSGVEVSDAGASETCCFHIDPVMMKYQANLLNDTSRGSTMPDGHSYNILAMGLEWGKSEYHDSAVGRGMPVEVVIEDRAMYSMSVSQSLDDEVSQ